MKSIYTLVLTLFSISLFAQSHPTCDGMRYKTEVFEEFGVTTGIQFGQSTTIGGEEKDLLMDIYYPIDDDAASRPAIVLAFGGSFIAGDRESMAFLCEAYAKRGFVAATIDYRLYDLALIPLPTEAEMKDVVVRTIGDMRAAIRFLREDAAMDNEYKIDPNLIFNGGISAGGIVACHTATIEASDAIPQDLLDLIDTHGGFEGNSSDNYDYSSEVSGTINFSGALNDADWLDANDPAIYSVHDDMDPTVPYAEGFGAVFGFDIVYLEGSAVIHDVAEANGVINQLHTIENSDGHVSYFLDATQTEEIIQESSEFLHELICPNGPALSVEDVDERLAKVSVFPNPSSGLVQLQNQENLVLDVVVYNAIGQQVQASSNVKSLDLTDYQKGLYLIEIASEGLEGKQMQRLIIE